MFVRNDLCKRIIKNCKTTNLEFLKLKEKLGLCFYEVICDLFARVYFNVRRNF